MLEVFVSNFDEGCDLHQLDLFQYQSILCQGRYSGWSRDYHVIMSYALTDCLEEHGS